MDNLERLMQVMDCNEFYFEIVNDRCRVTYMMNDAVESFLYFEDYLVSGEFIEEFDGETDYTLEHRAGELRKYALIIRQGYKNTLTLFFSDIIYECRPYNYGSLGHLWIAKNEFLRQIESRIGVMYDKYTYMGREVSNEAEERMSHLYEFPPISLFFPSIPKKYRIVRDDPWYVDGEAIDYMKSLAKDVGDRRFYRRLCRYEKRGDKLNAAILALMLKQNAHIRLVKDLDARIRSAAAEYPDRGQVQRGVTNYDGVENVFAFRQEPFADGDDGVEYREFALEIERGFVFYKVIVGQITD